MRETRLSPSAGFELREVPSGTGSTALRFSGYASVTCSDFDDDSSAYEMQDIFGSYVESVVRGAFKKTVAEGADVAFLQGHSGMALARTKSGTLRLS